jgi:hypothetical protein
MKPRRSIRRFDVFAEYRKQEEQSKGIPVDEAKGYGVWVAKVVASRAYGRGSSIGLSRGAGSGDGKKGSPHPLKDGKWHLLGDEVQDDKRFDAEIVRRMGEDFYREVFEPAIREARENGETYESIRDAIRREWKPEPVKPARPIRATKSAAAKKPRSTTAKKAA